MRTNELAVDVAMGLAAGLAATKATEYAQEALYRVTPRSVKQQEERARPGLPTDVAARKTAEALGLDLDARRLSRLSSAFHYGSGTAWGPVYFLLRRASGMNPLGAAIVTGASLSLILDETLTPALGFSAPNRAYPTTTHVRGFLAHLVYGFVLAATAEALYRLTRRAGRALARQ